MAKAKQTFWKLLGAAFTRDKGGVQALSLDKAMAAISFLVILGFVLARVDPIPSELIKVLFGTLGLNGLNSGIRSFTE